MPSYQHTYLLGKTHQLNKKNSGHNNHINLGFLPYFIYHFGYINMASLTCVFYYSLAGDNGGENLFTFIASIWLLSKIYVLVLYRTNIWKTLKHQVLQYYENFTHFDLKYL